MTKFCAEREGRTEERHSPVLVSDEEGGRVAADDNSHPFPLKKKPHTQLAVVQLLVVVRGMVIWCAAACEWALVEGGQGSSASAVHRAPRAALFWLRPRRHASPRTSSVVPASSCGV